MPSPMQEILANQVVINVKLDQLLARPQIQPEVNLEGTLALLGQILGKTDQILSAVMPQAPVDLNAQAQQALATLQAIQAQLQGQVQQMQAIVEPLEEPLIPEVI